MGTNMNFKGFGNEQPVELSGNGNFPLMRQSSVYSLTFDEFQNSLGKDFGSMNMDELLRSIWSAEETQNQNPVSATATNVVPGPGGVNQGNYLQRQGSITLPRQLSLKTVDEVWKDMTKEFEFSTGKETGGGSSVAQAQRQQTLGEMTLEEFLQRAGVVREDAQLAGGFWGDLAQANSNNSGFGISFQQPSSHKNAQISMQSTNLPLNVNGVRSSQPIAPQPRPHQQPIIFPKQNAVSYAPSVVLPSSTQLASPAIRGGVVGLADPTVSSAMGIVGLGGGLGAATGSPASLSSDGGLRSNGDTPSVSPVPYMFNGGLRGRRSNNTVEKVIERRHRRMIKNRESAARSRARKQAYTTDLEQEIARLKEENEVLRIKQAKILEMQKNQALEKMDDVHGAKKRCLRRTYTGPW